jgi:hypothetical protein
LKKYLKATIEEQINRGLILKKMIPYPLIYHELSKLSEGCERIIDENIRYLRYLRQEIETDNPNLRYILREFRTSTRNIELVESFGISALYYQTPELGYFNKLIFKINQEIKLPISPPSVACISTNYYYFHPFTDVIFVPLGESEFLLHLPDLFHEIGHAVISKREDNLKLKELNEKYKEIINIITKHYQKLITEKIRESGPEEIKLIIQHVHQQWKNYWIDEFLSDLFALYTLGPAFARAHLHLVTKRSKDIFAFSAILPQTHPSDDSRMKMLLIGLNIIGFKQEAEVIHSKWKEMPFSGVSRPIQEYQYAYPENLMENIASLFLEGLRKSNFAIITDKNEEQNQKTIIILLNDAWKYFWDEPHEFRLWEEKSIGELKRNYLGI